MSACERHRRADVVAAGPTQPCFTQDPSSWPDGPRGDREADLTESDRQRRGEGGTDAAELASGVRSSSGNALLLDAIRPYVASREVAAEVLASAVARAGLELVPSDAASVRTFVTRWLVQEVSERLGPDAVRGLEPLVRVLDLRAEAAQEPSPRGDDDAPPSAEIPAVIYVLADRPAIAARVRMLLGARAEVIRARSLEDVLRASALRVGWRSAVLIDLRPGCMLGVPAGETVVRVLGRMPAIVWADESTVDEVRRRSARSERITACSPDVRPEDVALLLELQLGDH